MTRGSCSQKKCRSWGYKTRDNPCHFEHDILNVFGVCHSVCFRNYSIKRCCLWAMTESLYEVSIKELRGLGTAQWCNAYLS